MKNVRIWHMASAAVSFNLRRDWCKDATAFWCQGPWAPLLKNGNWKRKDSGLPLYSLENWESENKRFGETFVFTGSIRNLKKKRFRETFVFTGSAAVWFPQILLCYLPLPTLLQILLPAWYCLSFLYFFTFLFVFQSNLYLYFVLTFSFVFGSHHRFCFAVSAVFALLSNCTFCFNQSTSYALLIAASAGLSNGFASPYSAS